MGDNPILQIFYNIKTDKISMNSKICIYKKKYLNKEVNKTIHFYVFDLKIETTTIFV